MPAFSVIDVYVNVLPRAGVTKEQIEKAIESANATLKKAGAKIRLEWNAKKHLRSPARVGGTNDDADVDPNERQVHRRRGQKELKRHFGGRGLKLWLCDHILVRRDGMMVPKGAGVSYHRSPNAWIALEEHRSGTGANRTLDTGEMGRTIAHELCHVLTIRGHHAGADNLMNETGGGSKLETDQLEEIGKGATERARATKTKETPGGAPAKKTTKLGYWVDENEPPSQGLLACARVLQAGPGQPWSGLVQLVEAIDPARPIELSVVMRVPDPVGAEPAAAGPPPVRVEISVRGDGAGAPVPAGTVTDRRTGRSAPLETIVLERQDLIVDDFAQAQPELLPAFDEVEFEVDPEAIGDPADGTTIELELAEAITGARVDAHVTIESGEGGPRAKIDLDRYLVAPGEAAAASGRGFTPGCSVEVYLDDDPVGTAGVGADGRFHLELAAPKAPGFYWVRAVDACGESDFTILDVA